MDDNEANPIEPTPYLDLIGAKDIQLRVNLRQSTKINSLLEKAGIEMRQPIKNQLIKNIFEKAS